MTIEDGTYFCPYDGYFTLKSGVIYFSDGFTRKADHDGDLPVICIPVKNGSDYSVNDQVKADPQQ